MSLSGVGSTAGAQAANQSIAATADVNGAITFVGPQGIQGSTITAVVTVPGAPAGAIFTATLGTIGGQGVIVGDWGGGSTAGQFQIGVGQTLTVAGSGLSPGKAYTCTFGTVTDIGDVNVVIPTPGFSALLATLANAGLGGVGVLTAFISNIAAGTNGGKAFTTSIQIWSFGAIPPSFPGTWPSTGGLIMNLAGPAPANLTLGSDPLTPGNLASNRLSGIRVAPGTVSFQNDFNVAVTVALNYSVVP